MSTSLSSAIVRGFDMLDWSFVVFVGGDRIVNMIWGFYQ